MAVAMALKLNNGISGQVTCFVSPTRSYCPDNSEEGSVVPLLISNNGTSFFLLLQQDVEYSASIKKTRN